MFCGIGSKSVPDVCVGLDLASGCELMVWVFFSLYQQSSSVLSHVSYTPPSVCLRLVHVSLLSLRCWVNDRSRTHSDSDTWHREPDQYHRDRLIFHPKINGLHSEKQAESVSVFDFGENEVKMQKQMVHLVFGVKYDPDPDIFTEICRICMWSFELGSEKCHDLIQFTSFRFNINSFGYTGSQVQYN